MTSRPAQSRAERVLVFSTVFQRGRCVRRGEAMPFEVPVRDSDEQPSGDVVGFRPIGDPRSTHRSVAASPLQAIGNSKRNRHGPTAAIVDCAETMKKAMRRVEIFAI